MDRARSFRELIVWQKAIAFAQEIYTVTRKFPLDEKYSLTSQIRRAAVSIASNIAEGRCRGTRKDFIQFLRIAYGSCAEVETQLILSKSLFITEKIDYNKVDSLLEEIQKILATMISRLQAPESSKL